MVEYSKAYKAMLVKPKKHGKGAAQHKRKTKTKTVSEEDVSKSIFSNKFCNKFILQSNDKDPLRCFVKQIINDVPFVQWCDYSVVERLNILSNSASPR